MDLECSHLLGKREAVLGLNSPKTGHSSVCVCVHSSTPAKEAQWLSPDVILIMVQKGNHVEVASFSAAPVACFDQVSSRFTHRSRGVRTNHN